jgi:hypothetical protein
MATAMRWMTVAVAAALVLAGSTTSSLAANVKDKMKVEIESVGLHPGMDPGMYVCAGGHLHIKGTVQNRSGVPVGPVKVEGKAFNADGKLLGTAIASTKQTVIAPNEKAEINVEFLTVTGPAIQQVKRHAVTVIDAPTRQ